MRSAKKKVYVYVISDGTGITAERVISAVLVQFNRQVEPVVERFSFVKTTKQISRVLDSAEDTHGVVIYSLVAANLRDWIRKENVKRRLVLIDLLGPLLDRMVRLFNVMPSQHPGLLGALGEESLRLAESIDYTLRHDDGGGLNTLGRADVIILGVSRTSKTPTSLYLSCNRCLKVANVPIILEVKPPSQIFTLKRPRKIGFIISPEKLIMIRRRRYKERSVPGYTDPRVISRELNYCQRIFQRIKDLKIIDVTSTSIEEVANLIA